MMYGRMYGSQARIGWVVGVVLVGLVAGCATPEPAAPDRPKRVFRIQLAMSGEKAEAESVVRQARSWWDALAPSERPQALEKQGFQPDVVWRQPYYRVRVGRFNTRSAAQDALAAVRSRFPDALITPVRVEPARQ